ncbi:hypothetical protein DIPPA_34505 [Diplonema papillatum]|nr:hypothetical protein DIPPA_34505 [Diplonema papillatum]
MVAPAAASAPAPARRYKGRPQYSEVHGTCFYMGQPTKKYGRRVTFERGGGGQQALQSSVFGPAPPGGAPAGPVRRGDRPQLRKDLWQRSVAEKPNEVPSAVSDSYPPVLRERVGLHRIYVDRSTNSGLDQPETIAPLYSSFSGDKKFSDPLQRRLQQLKQLMFHTHKKPAVWRSRHDTPAPFEYPEAEKAERRLLIGAIRLLQSGRFRRPDRQSAGFDSVIPPAEGRRQVPPGPTAGRQAQKEPSPSREARSENDHPATTPAPAPLPTRPTQSQSWNGRPVTTTPSPLHPTTSVPATRPTQAQSDHPATTTAPAPLPTRPTQSQYWNGRPVVATPSPLHPAGGMPVTGPTQVQSDHAAAAAVTAPLPTRPTQSQYWNGRPVVATPSPLHPAGSMPVTGPTQVQSDHAAAAAVTAPLPTRPTQSQYWNGRPVVATPSPLHPAGSMPVTGPTQVQSDHAAAAAVTAPPPTRPTQSQSWNGRPVTTTPSPFHPAATSPWRVPSQGDRSTPASPPLGFADGKPGPGATAGSAATAGAASSSPGGWCLPLPSNDPSSGLDPSDIFFSPRPPSATTPSSILASTPGPSHCSCDTPLSSELLFADFHRSIPPARQGA